MIIKNFPECPNFFEHKGKIKKTLSSTRNHWAAYNSETVFIHGEYLHLLNIWYVKIHSDPVIFLMADFSILGIFFEYIIFCYNFLSKKLFPQKLFSLKMTKNCHNCLYNMKRCLRFFTLIF